MYDNQRHIFELNKNGDCKVDSESRTINVTTGNYSQNIQLRLFGVHDANTYGKWRVYNFKLYRGTYLMMDLVPVRIGQVGYMYDQISGALYPNSGTGDFILGPDVVE